MASASASLGRYFTACTAETNAADQSRSNKLETRHRDGIYVDLRLDDKPGSSPLRERFMACSVRVIFTLTLRKGHAVDGA